MFFPSRNIHIGLSHTFPKHGTADSYTMWDKCLQTFRRKVLPPSSGQLNLAQTNRSDWLKSLQYSYIIKKTSFSQSLQHPPETNSCTQTMVKSCSSETSKRTYSTLCKGPKDRNLNSTRRKICSLLLAVT